MRKALPLALIAIVSVSAFVYAWRADDDVTTTGAEPDSNQIAGEIEVGTGGSTTFIGGSTALPDSASQAAAGALPGVTVTGYGDATAKPDAAIIRISAGSGSGAISFGSSDTFRFELIDEAEVQPVVDVIRGKGVAEEDIHVTTSAGGQFSPFEGGAVHITFRWGNPDDIKAVLDAAEVTLRQKTDHELQNVEVLYTISECEPLENEATQAALEDARQRAERLAELSGASLGGIIAVSESPAASIYGLPVQSGCAALQELPPLDFGSAIGGNSAAEVEVDVNLQVTFALE